MILFCQYGIDPAAPEKGVVRAHYDAMPAGGHHSDMLAVPYDGAIEALGRFGPEPRPMGDPPRSHFKSHVELDAEQVPLDHPWRALAGRPIESDNRRLEADMRPWAAPDLTDDIARSAKRIEMAAALDAADAGGFVSAALGGEEPHRYPSDADSVGKLQMAALAALAGQAKPGWTAALRCAETKKGEVSGPFVGVPHKAGQIHAVLADYQAFADALHAERDAIEARIAATLKVDKILAIDRG